jgi:protein-S-isoprenylcysteine O-methyltransferase Ste14
MNLGGSSKALYINFLRNTGYRDGGRLSIPLFHFGVALREERYLAAQFGEPYLHYRREVRRWI